jgi:hypothetical protein
MPATNAASTTPVAAGLLRRPRRQWPAHAVNAILLRAVDSQQIFIAAKSIDRWATATAAACSNVIPAAMSDAGSMRWHPARIRTWPFAKRSYETRRSVLPTVQLVSCVTYETNDVSHATPRPMATKPWSENFIQEVGTFHERVICLTAVPAAAGAQHLLPKQSGRKVQVHADRHHRVDCSIPHQTVPRHRRAAVAAPVAAPALSMAVRCGPGR